MDDAETAIRWKQIPAPPDRHAHRPALAPAAIDHRPVPVRLRRLADDPRRHRRGTLGCSVAGHRRADAAVIRPGNQCHRCIGAPAVVAPAAEAGPRHRAQRDADRPLRTVRAVAAAAGRRPWLAAGDVLCRHAAGGAGHRPVHRCPPWPGATRWPDDRSACPYRLADLEGAQPDRRQRTAAGLVPGRQCRPRHPRLRPADRAAVRSDAGLVRDRSACSGSGGGGGGPPPGAAGAPTRAAAPAPPPAAPAGRALAAPRPPLPPPQFGGSAAGAGVGGR